MSFITGSSVLFMPLAHTYLFTGVRTCPAWSSIQFSLKTTSSFKNLFLKKAFLRFDTHDNLGTLGFAEVFSGLGFKKVQMFGRYLVTNLCKESSKFSFNIGLRNGLKRKEMYSIVHLTSFVKCAEPCCLCLQEVMTYHFTFVFCSLQPFLSSYLETWSILIQREVSQQTDCPISGFSHTKCAQSHMHFFTVNRPSTIVGISQIKLRTTIF